MQYAEMVFSKGDLKLLLKAVDEYKTGDRDEELDFDGLSLRLNYEIDRMWKPRKNQQASCKCSHPYERHFDSYEDMLPVGCKYCECGNFEDAV